MSNESSQNEPQEHPENDAHVEVTNGDVVETDAQSSADPLTQMTQERDQFRDQFLRMAAELENFRKRANRERDEERTYASFSLIRDLLPAIDNLHRAIDAADANEATRGVLSGVEMVLKQIDEILARHGAEEIEALNQPFDPNLHEALQQRDEEGVPPLTVLQVHERGYRMKDRVIRPSKVIVSSE